MNSTSVVKKLFIIAATLFALLASACSKSGGGYAPGLAEPIASAQNKNVFLSQSQQVTTSNGWVLDADQTNPVQSKTLVNGWKVEVRYE